MLSALIGVICLLSVQQWVVAGSANEDGLSTILSSFSVRRGQIIRPTQSQAAGARYLNDSAVDSNHLCLLWCWETTRCNVAIYGSVSGGSSVAVAEGGAKGASGGTNSVKGADAGAGTRPPVCYLFDCGPGARKCSFTHNDNYMTSVLVSSSVAVVRGRGADSAEDEDLTAEQQPTSEKHTQQQQQQQDMDMLSGQQENDKASDNDSLPPRGAGGAHPSCSKDHVRCVLAETDVLACLPKHRKCDGRADCRDASDESDCAFRPPPMIPQAPPSNHQGHRYRGDLGEPEDESSFAADFAQWNRPKTIHRRPDQQALGGLPPHARMHTVPTGAKRGQQEAGRPLGQAAKGPLADEAAKPASPHAPGGHDHDSPSVSISLTQVDSGSGLKAGAGGESQQSGAILAMALGLCVTALLLVLVGCKLRLVRRRLVNWRRENRKGLGLLADDDDDEDEDEVVHGII